MSLNLMNFVSSLWLGFAGVVILLSCILTSSRMNRSTRLFLQIRTALSLCVGMALIMMCAAFHYNPADCENYLDFQRAISLLSEGHPSAIPQVCSAYVLSRGYNIAIILPVTATTLALWTCGYAYYVLFGDRRGR